METNQSASLIGSGWYVPLGNSASTNCTVEMIPTVDMTPYVLPRVDRGFEWTLAHYRPLLCRLGDAPGDSTPPGG